MTTLTMKMEDLNLRASADGTFFILPCPPPSLPPSLIILFLRPSSTFNNTNACFCFAAFNGQPVSQVVVLAF